MDDSVEAPPPEILLDILHFRCPTERGAYLAYRRWLNGQEGGLCRVVELRFGRVKCLVSYLANRQRSVIESPDRRSCWSFTFGQSLRRRIIDGS